MLGALDEHRLPAETTHHLGELHSCRAATQHEQAAGDRLHARRLAGAPDPLEVTQPGDRRHEGVGARGHHDVFRRVADTVDIDQAGAGQPPRPSQKIDAAVRQPALLTGVGVVGDHEVPPGQRGLDVDVGCCCGLAGGMDRLPGTQQ